MTHEATEAFSLWSMLRSYMGPIHTRRKVIRIVTFFQKNVNNFVTKSLLRYIILSMITHNFLSLLQLWVVLGHLTQLINNYTQILNWSRTAKSIISLKTQVGREKLKKTNASLFGPQAISFFIFEHKQRIQTLNSKQLSSKETQSLQVNHENHNYIKIHQNKELNWR